MKDGPGRGEGGGGAGGVTEVSGCRLKRSETKRGAHKKQKMQIKSREWSNQKRDTGVYAKQG